MFLHSGLWGWNGWERFSGTSLHICFSSRGKGRFRGNVCWTTSPPLWTASKRSSDRQPTGRGSLWPESEPAPGCRWETSFTVHTHTSIEVTPVSSLPSNREANLKRALERCLSLLGSSTSSISHHSCYHQCVITSMFCHLMVPLQWFSDAGSDRGHHWRRPEADPGAGVSYHAIRGADEKKKKQVSCRVPIRHHLSHQTCLFCPFSLTSQLLMTSSKTWGWWSTSRETW